MLTVIFRPREITCAATADVQTVERSYPTRFIINVKRSGYISATERCPHSHPPPPSTCPHRPPAPIVQSPTAVESFNPSETSSPLGAVDWTLSTYSRLQLVRPPAARLPTPARRPARPCAAWPPACTQAKWETRSTGDRPAGWPVAGRTASVDRSSVELYLRGYSQCRRRRMKGWND